MNRYLWLGGNRRMRVIQYLMAPVMLFCMASVSANSNVAMRGSEVNIYDDNSFFIGVGSAIVKFDTNIKVKRDGELPYFIDLEGDLDLPAISYVATIYGGYDFNEKHSLNFAAFGINRQSTLLDFNKNFEDIILVSANMTLTDKTRFYFVDYGYTFFRDDRSDMTFVVGINGMDLHLVAEGSGQITVLGVTESKVLLADANVFVPLPLIGLNFGFSFTPKWRFEAAVSLVGGTHKDITATIGQSSMNFRYKLAKHVGVILGVTYFDADIEIKNDNVLTEVSYGYNGGFLGVHFGF